MSETPRSGTPGSQQQVELAKLENDRTRIERSAAPVGRMIQLISLIAGLIAVIVVLSVVAIAIIPAFIPNVEIKIPDVLANWGGIILGFYFGQFINLVKDYLGVIQGNATPANPG